MNHSEKVEERIEETFAIHFSFLKVALVANEPLMFYPQNKNWIKSPMFKVALRSSHVAQHAMFKDNYKYCSLIFYSDFLN